MRAIVGDQLVGPAAGAGSGELLGVVTGTMGRNGRSPFVIRWYADDRESEFTPDPGSHWIRSLEVPPACRVVDGVPHGSDRAHR